MTAPDCTTPTRVTPRCVLRWIRRHPFKAVSGILIALLFALAGVWLTNQISNAQEVRQEIRHQGAYLVECTTPGPLPPPNTGHPCYDAGQRRTAEVVSQIVDSNGNGVPDIEELASSLGVPLSTTTTLPRGNEHQ